MAIYYIDRKTGRKEKEKVAGEKYLKWINETQAGNMILETIVKRKIFSALYGRLQDTGLSRKKITPFIEKYHINTDEAERKDIHSYRSFNDFFTRKLKKESRPIILNEEVLVSPADGRIFAYENIDINMMLQIKGSYYRLDELLNSKNLANEYWGGACLVIRLAPTDYHRFHFPDSGIPKQSEAIKGNYYSVSPIALKERVKIYCQNKREITIFESDNFNKIVLVEVGATCVGSIVQTYKSNHHVKKGTEKGYFKFGGSTIIMLLKKDIVTIDNDILQNTSAGYETKVNIGESIGKRKVKTL